jgi:cytochrome c-type biogenesis protein CcmH
VLRWLWLPVVAAILIAATSPLSVSADEPELSVREVASQLFSQCGSGMILADHSCGVAHSMKTSIQEQIDAGKTKEEILDHFVSIYGEQVLATPRKSGFSLAAWVIPLVGLAAGAVLGATLTWAWTRRRPSPVAVGALPAPSEELEVFEKRVDDDLRLLE